MRLSDLDVSCLEIELRDGSRVYRCDASVPISQNWVKGFGLELYTSAFERANGRVVDEKLSVASPVDNTLVSR